MSQAMSNQIVLIATGEELVAGRQQESNCAYMAAAFERHGIPVLAHLTLGDRQTPLVEALLQFATRARFIIVSGGLGPTADDRTRYAVAAAAGRELVEDPETVEHLEAFFRRRGQRMSPTNRVQAAFPAGADILPNEAGTARGFAVALGEAEVIAVPGVPREMRQMFDQQVLPRVLAALPEQAQSCSRTIKLFGLAESEVDERLSGLIDEEQNPAVGITVKDGIISVSVIGSGEDAEAVRRSVDVLEQEIVRRLGRAVYGRGEERLEEACARLLEQTDSRVATAESCTGGLIGHMLTNVAGISQFYMEGIIAYSNLSKIQLLSVDPSLIERFGAVSFEVAEAMAEGARRRCDVDIAVSTTGIAGPTGGTPAKPVGLVYVGIAERERVRSFRLLLHGDREMVKDRAAKHALNTLRQFLLGKLEGT